MKKLMIGMSLLAAGLFAQDTTMLTHPGDATATYQAIVNQLNKDGVNIETASKDAGIQTAVAVVKGGYRQTGNYTKITFIDEGGSTTARVAVYEVKRFKAFKAEPWSDPKVNAAASQAQAETLKKELGW
jgi:hypothetical protein